MPVPRRELDERARHTGERPIGGPVWLRRGVWLVAALTVVMLVLALLVGGVFGWVFYVGVVATLLGFVCRGQLRRSRPTIHW